MKQENDELLGLLKLSLGDFTTSEGIRFFVELIFLYNASSTDGGVQWKQYHTAYTIIFFLRIGGAGTKIKMY